VSLHNIRKSEAPDGATAETVPATAGAEATTTQSQSIAAAHTQTNAITIIPPSGTLVPSGFVFVETSYEPNQDVTSEEVTSLSDNDLLTGLKKQHKRTQEQLDAFVVFFDEVVARYSDEQPRTATGEFQCGDRPTLPEAFAAISLNYETERKRKQRYLAAMSVRFTVPKPLQLAEGDTVKLKDGSDSTEYAVVNLHRSVPKADVVSKGSVSGKVITFPTDSLKKVKPLVRKVKVGDLILCGDNGAEYQYVGGGKFSRTKTLTLLEQKREGELAAIKAKKEREAAKAEEKKRQQELRKAEAARRDLERIAEKKRRKAEADAQKQAVRQRKVAAAAEKATKRSKGTGAKPAPTPAKVKLVKVARIGETRDFGVFPEPCHEYNADNALTIGTRAACESERDRINAKRHAEHGSQGNAPNATVRTEIEVSTSGAEVPLG
jgi:hypothetical protein